MATRNGNSITWTTYNLATLVNGSGVSAAFSYGADRQRKQQISTYTADGTVGTETTTYVNGIFEIVTTPAQTHYKHLVLVPGGTRVIYDLQSVSGVQTTYLTADHLGSGNLLINAAGSVLINESYAAYGYRRTSDWRSPMPASSPDYSTIASTTRRGYSNAFHEMLDNVGLIHMNGRVYDPTIGRFLSADPVLIPAPAGDSQLWNPYAYAANRVLTVTDPTGRNLCVETAPPQDAPPPPEGCTDPLSGACGEDAYNLAHSVPMESYSNCFTDPGSTPMEPPQVDPPPVDIPQIEIPTVSPVPDSVFDGPGSPGETSPARKGPPCKGGYREATPEERASILAYAQSLLGTSYTSKGMSPQELAESLDCSGFVSEAIQETVNPSFPRVTTSSALASPGLESISASQGGPADIELWPGHHMGFYDPVGGPKGQSFLSSRGLPKNTDAQNPGVSYSNTDDWEKTQRLGNPKWLRILIPCTP